MNESELKTISGKVEILFHIRGSGPGGWDPIVRTGKIRWVNKKTVGVDLDEPFYGRKFYSIRHERILK